MSFSECGCWMDGSTAEVKKGDDRRFLLIEIEV